MRLALAGGSYEDRTLAAAVNESLNLYPETIQDPAGSGKGVLLPLASPGQALAPQPSRVMNGTPGLHLFKNFNGHAGVVRGMASGGNISYVAVGPLTGTGVTYYYAFDNAGTILNNSGAGWALPSVAANGGPVQLIPTGNQLAIIADGQLYADNGAGPVAVRFSTERFDLQISPENTSACWDSVVPFLAGDVGNTLEVVGGDGWTLQTVTITSVVAAYGQSLAICSASLGSIWGGTVTRADMVLDSAINTNCSSAGTPFTTADVGNCLQIIGGTGWNLIVTTITAVDGSGNATCDMVLGTLAATGGESIEFTPDASGDAIEFDQTADGLVTAVTSAILDQSLYVQRPVTSSPDLGRQVNFSMVSDITRWSALDFFSKESASDHIQSIYADREMLFVFGDGLESEVWQNSPSTGRPALMTGAVCQEPSACRFGVVSMNEQIYFIGGANAGSPVAYAVNGFTPSPVSTPAVIDQWKENGVNIANAVSFWYLDEGHYFWVIWFSSGSAWVYDATERQWHERQCWNGSNLIPYRPWVHTFLPAWSADAGATQGVHLVGDYSSAKVLIMNLAYGDEEGADTYRQRAMPYLYSQGRRVYVGRVDLTQAAPSNTAASAPVVKLDWSQDDGETFSTAEVGQTGTGTGALTYWFTQGSFELSAIPRLTIIGQIPVTLIELDAEVSYGDV